MKARRVTTVAAVAVTAGAGGVVVTYLFDPDTGRTRRNHILDRSRAALRRTGRSVGRRARSRRHRLSGRMRRVIPRRHRQPENDQVLVDKVRSEVLGRMYDLAPHVSIDATNSVVSLRGQLDVGADIARLERAVREVDGVSGVINLLHRTGEPAPNKAPAINATR